IQINGENPAHIHVGDSYLDLGATITSPNDADKNLGLKHFLNGALVSDIAIDTTTPATDTIDYVATDQSGLAATLPASSSSRSLRSQLPRKSLRHQQWQPRPGDKSRSLAKCARRQRCEQRSDGNVSPSRTQTVTRCHLNA